MISVLLVNHNLSKLCGIYAHGIRMSNILSHSNNYKFIYTECGSIDDISKDIKNYNPKVIIYNYTKHLLPWADVCKQLFPKIKHIALCHDITQDRLLEDSSFTTFFDYRIVLDPTLKVNEKWFTTVRPLFGYKQNKDIEISDTISVGSFGFYFKHKNFNIVILEAIKQLKNLKLNLHITDAHFSTNKCKEEFKAFKIWASEVSKQSDVEINISSNYISDKEQIDFLANNHINMFIYDYNYGSGPSSAIDYAVAAGRPIIVNNSFQFNHVKGRLPTIMDTSIMEAITFGNREILKLQDEWSESTFIMQYEEIINKVIKNEMQN